MASPLTALAAPTRQDVIITFSVTCFDAAGGAVQHPGATVPTMSNTYSVSNVLNNLDGWIGADLFMPDRILIDNITAWIGGLFVNDTTNDPNYGGFLPHASALNATMTASGFAAQTLDLLNRTESIDSTNLIAFAVNLQRTNATLFPDTVGGFIETNQTSEATVSATYFAIQILDVYAAIPQMNTSLAVGWLNSSQLLAEPSSASYGGFANGRNTTIADLQTTYMALRSLEILGALSSIDETAAINYILSHYQNDLNYPQFYGGFSNTPDNPVATHFATFYSVASLFILNADDQLTTDDIATWVLSTQTRDGGFADVTGPTGFAPQTNLAVSTLVLLDQLPLLLLPVGPELFVFPWWIVGIAVVVILIVLCIIIARRSDWF